MEGFDSCTLNSEKWTLIKESEHFNLNRVHVFMADVSLEAEFPDFYRVVSKVTGVSKNFVSYVLAVDYVNAFEEGYSYGRKER